MGAESKIQWTHHTWSPWRGCFKLSPGCDHCYAEFLSHRNPAVLGEWGPDGKRVVNARWDVPLAWDRRAAKLGERHRVFPSLCDPFEDREDLIEPFGRFLALIEATPNLDWLVLTKRPENFDRLIERVAMAKPLGVGQAVAAGWNAGIYPPNLWMGVSVESQEYADSRITALGQIPAAVRWCSYEPALDAIDVEGLPRLDWLVCGGESGSDTRRPFDARWARSIRDQCERLGTAFYMKQLGSNPVGRDIDRALIRDKKGGEITEFPPDLQIRELPTEFERN